MRWDGELASGSLDRVCGPPCSSEPRPRPVGGRGIFVLRLWGGPREAVWGPSIATHPTPHQPCTSSQPSQTVCKYRRYFLRVTLSLPLCLRSVLPTPVCGDRCFYHGKFAEPG